ncbi:MAG: hypothetical protein WCY89_04140 [Flavobacteriaceae bacterium]
MQTYINQLLEILNEAHNNRPAPRYLELPEEMECLRDVIEWEMSIGQEEPIMENLLGVPQHYFPPENRLTDDQIKQLTAGIVELWKVFHFVPDFRKGEFDERQQYTKLVEKWKDKVPDFRGSNGFWHLEMFDYELNWDEDEMRYLSDGEYDAKYFPDGWDTSDENELT